MDRILSAYFIVVRQMGDLTRNLLCWPKHALLWLLKAWLAWLAIAVLGLSLVVPLLWIGTADSLRYSGLFMQLLGLGTVAIGIRDTRRMFGKPSMLELFRRWHRNIPIFGPKVIQMSGSAPLNITESAKAHVWRGSGKNPTLESRLEAAEANLGELYGRLNRFESESNHEIRKIVSKLRAESAERKEQDRQLHHKIEVASADGLHLAAVGVVWLMAGVILSTIPQELLLLAR